MPLLSPLVECWATHGDARAGIIPADGCMDLVWNGSGIVVAGPDSRARRFTPAGRTPMWGARFHPGLLPSILRVPASELTDRYVPIDQRVLRLRRAQVLLDQGLSVTEAAARLDYADASHLWRDRRDLGTAPT